MIFNAVRRLNFKKRKFRFECAPPAAIGLWADSSLIATLDPAEAKRLRDWLTLALPPHAVEET